MGRSWLVLPVTGSVWVDTGWYLVVVGQYGAKLVDTVAFPYRKSHFLDNKLEFSGIKLAESYGFRYSNFKVNSQVIQVSLWCFKFKPFGYFRLQWYWLYPHDGTGSPSWRRKQPMCLFKG